MHLGSQTNRNQASATENWAHCGDIAFLLAAVWRIVCMWHSWLSVPLCLLIYLARISFLLLLGGTFPFPCVLGVLFATSVGGAC